MKKALALFLSILFILLPVAIAENIDYDLTYDSNGNLLRGINHQYEYDGFNQLSRVLDGLGNLLEEYTYDDQGNRIKKLEHLEGGETRTTYYPHKNLVRVVDSSGTHDTYYYYDDAGTLLMRKDPDGRKFYYHPDHLGSTTLVTNEAGEVVEETSYMPFGEVLEGGSDRFQFTGKERDATGLTYFGARYYDPVLQKFTQPDTLVQDVYDPQSLNRYSYVRNNPYTYKDDTGNFFFAVVAGWMIAGAVINAGFDMISQIWSNGASMFDSSMDWSSVGRSASIGAGAGLAGGAGWAVGGSGILAGGLAGVTSGVTNQVLTNIAYEQSLTEGVGVAGIVGVTIGSIFGMGGRVANYFKTPKIDLNSGAVQEFPMQNLYGTHQLQKENILTPEKIQGGIGKGPVEIYNYKGNLIIGDGMGRTAREYLLYRKTTVKGRILNADPTDLGAQEVAANMYKWKNDKNILKQFKKLK